jgi:type IV pilus assembly protein PilB
MAAARVRLGDLLVESQIIRREQLDEILSLQKKDGRRIGTLLVEAGLVSETQVTQILSQQLSVPWVSLYHIDFSRQLLNLVSHELVDKYCLVPIFVRRVRGLGDTLYVAMDDPSDEQAQREVSQHAGLPVRAMIAPPTDIRSAIRVYYGVGKDTSSLSEAVAEVDAESSAVARLRAAAEAREAPDPDEPPSEQTPPEKMPPAELRKASGQMRAVRLPSQAPPPEKDARDSSPQIEAREISMPAPKKKGGARMVTLTLLDGTKVNLPALSKPKNVPAKAKSVPPAEGELTAGDLVAALRAVSHGADASEILGDQVHWQALFAALLSLLLKKHLIADWEFVEEYKKV